MTVVQPNSIAGINSISVQSGQSLSIHKSDGTLIREIVASTGISTYSSISVGSATTTNNANKSINIGLGASISQHADNSLSFGTNGDERVRLDSSGNFGINQTSPQSLLSLGAGTDPIKLLLYDNANTNKYGFGIQANELRTFYPDNSRLVIGTIAVSDGSTFSEKIRIKSDGNVGIGTSSPGYLLHLKNAGTADCAIKIESESGYDAYLALDSSNGGGAETDIKFQMDGTTKGTISYVNNAGSADVNCMIFRNNANTERMKIKADGDIEVGGNLKTNNITGKNKIINGNFHIWQRGTSSTANGYVAADRWYHDLSGANMTFSRQAHTDPIDGSRYYARLATTSSDDYCGIRQRIEDAASIPEGKITVSFWARGHVNGNLAVWGTIHYGSGGSPSSDVDIAEQRTGYLQNDTTFRKYSLTFTIPSHSGKTWGTNNDSYVELLFGQGTGDSASAWTLDISNIQVEIGSIATAFEQRSYGEELARCQRYYQQLGSTDANLSGDYAMLPGYTYYNGQRIATGYVSNVKMRTTPTIAEIGNGIAAYGQGTHSQVATIFGINTATDTNFIIFTVDGTNSKDWGDIDHAMVITNKTGGGMSFSAEL